MENGSGPSAGDPYQQGKDRTNQYALVAYIEGRLGDFLYSLRQEIVPACMLRSHVSVLPPRPLAGSEEDAKRMLQRSTRQHPAFEVGLEEIEVFPVTDVIYVGLGQGVVSLHEMHDHLNAGPLGYREPFSYHPHITLAQEIPQADHAAALDLCRQRWREYNGPRSFPVEALTFVQNRGTCGWEDLLQARLEMAGSLL